MDPNNIVAIQQTSILNHVDGVKPQRTMLIDFLNRHQISIACILETHLIQNEIFKVAGYTTYRKDRETIHASGGVAISINNRIKHNELPPFNCCNIEVIGV